MNLEYKHPVFKVYDDGNVLIQCPLCGGDYTHMVDSGWLQGSDEVEADAPPNGEIIGFTVHRRHAHAVCFECEMCQKSFSIVIQQHKGQNFVEPGHDTRINEKSNEP